MKLSEWAKLNGISYLTAYRWFKAGRLPTNIKATQTETGTILIDQKESDMLSKYSVPRRKQQDTIMSLFDSAIDGAFQDFFSNGWMHGLRDKNRFRIINQEGSYCIVGELPGYKEDEISIEIKGNVLTVSGSHKITEEEKTYFSEEQSVFQNSFTLPNDVVTDEVRADHSNGILRLIIPRLSRASPKALKVPINKA